MTLANRNTSFPTYIYNVFFRRRCNRAARVGSRYCFQHQRECTDSTDPISLTPLRDDIIRIEAENGLVHCFNADTFKLYIESRIEHYPRIANPLTNDPIPEDQLDAIILRLRIDPRHLLTRRLINE